MDLTDGQYTRLRMAIASTEERMATCKVPRNARAVPLGRVRQEMMKLFEAGEEYPNSPTEMLWFERVRDGYRYCSGDRMIANGGNDKDLPFTHQG